MLQNASQESRHVLILLNRIDFPVACFCHFKQPEKLSRSLEIGVLLGPKQGAKHILGCLELPESWGTT